VRELKVEKINNGVIFIDECKEKKKERTYWFLKYLQDLQNRGISQKINSFFLTPTN